MGASQISQVEVQFQNDVFQELLQGLAIDFLLLDLSVDDYLFEVDIVIENVLDALIDHFFIFVEDQELGDMFGVVLNEAGQILNVVLGLLPDVHQLDRLVRRVLLQVDDVWVVLLDVLSDIVEVLLYDFEV